MAVSGLLRRVAWERFSDVSEVFAASINRTRGLLIALMTEEASTSETLVNFYQTTRRNNPEDSHLPKASFCVYYDYYVFAAGCLDGVFHEVSSRSG
jgi:hypothetical protein